MHERSVWPNDYNHDKTGDKVLQIVSFLSKHVYNRAVLNIVF